MYILILDIILKNKTAPQQEKCPRRLIYTTLEILSNILPAMGAEKTASTGLPIHTWAPFFPTSNH